jgi:glycosyltransferase involved in cell wall biosynthesis
MKVSVITPTADQPTGMKLAERWMKQQTLQPDEWVVADDGESHALLSLGQAHIIRERTYERGASLAANVLAGLERVTGDVVVIWEHDDYYHPNHIRYCCQRLAGRSGATGSEILRYFNIAHRQWVIMQNIGSALCNTAFTSDLIPVVREHAERLLETKGHNLDALFWASLHHSKKFLHRTNTVVGIKGLPGRKGLGIGHRVDSKRSWQTDPKGEVLQAWIGKDAEPYLELLGPV